MVYKVDALSGLLPRTCALCGTTGMRGRLDICTPCHNELPWHGPACQRCAMPLTGAGATLCAACLRRPPPMSATIAALRYEYPVADLLARFKFSGSQVVGHLLGELLAERIRREPEATHDRPVLVPVPLHVSRLRERGFNQSLGIARLLANQLGLPLRLDLIHKPLAGTDQKRLGATERRANLRGAFRASACDGLRIALVDDVVTTGATAEAIAGELLRQGASDVRVWCIARAL